MERWRCLAFVLLALASAAGPSVRPANAGDVVCVPDWSQIEAPFFPLGPATPVQPVLSAADVTDVSADFVADPFLLQHQGLWYLFFEIAVPLARIGVAVSTDALAWRYERVVLAEPFAMSYPHVFQVDGTIYMTPESASQDAVRLYRSDAFPGGWRHVANLVTGRPFADPTLFRHGGMWWMFVGDAASETCWLYSSRVLDSDWTEHPASPIVSGNRARARPAGRAIVLAGDRAYRLAQNSSPTYGRSVRVFEIDVLTADGYAEHEITASPIVTASGAGWNADGMHQVDAWWTGDGWIAATDGLANGIWSIGIYHTGGVPSDLASPRTSGTLDLVCAPNPSRGRATLRWNAGAHAAPVELAVYTPSGRRLLARTLPASASAFVWDGTDARGRAVAAGVYYCTLRAGSSTAATRVVVSR